MKIRSQEVMRKRRGYGSVCKEAYGIVVLDPTNLQKRDNLISPVETILLWYQ